MSIITFPIWKRVRIQMIVIMILTAAIVISLEIAIPIYQEMRKEADFAYSEAIKIREQRVEIKEVKKDGDEVSTSTQVQPKEGNGEVNPSPAPSGIIADILPRIHRLESSGGINDSCLQYGKVNGYGFGIYKDHFRCYETKEKVEKEVADWFKDNLKTYTLAQSLCRYNTGTPTNDCVYAQKFVNL